MSAVREDFTEGEFVVYPAHGVGRFLRTESQEVSGQSIDLFVIDFPKDKMTLRIPAKKAVTSGLRHPSSREVMDKALSILRGRARIKRIVWTRRSQEYETKINSGNPCCIAEVIRELAGLSADDKSYSERLVYQAALERFARELAIVEKINEEEAMTRVNRILRSV